MSDFCHLHVHTEFSFLDGLGTSKMAAEKVREHGHTHLAITDHGNIAGSLHHLNACEEQEITPILGMEAYYCPDRTLRGKENSERWHMVLLAKNMEGWKNLIRLSSLAHGEGYYYKPRIDLDLLSRYGEGLMASASCLAGWIPNMLLNGRDKEAQEHLNMMLNIFGDDFYFEIQPHDIDEQRTYNLMAADLASKHGVPLVATADSHYPCADWADTHDVLLLANTGTKRSERKEGEARGEEFMRFQGDTYWLMDEIDMWEAFKKHHPNLPKHVVQSALQATSDIAERIQPFTISREPKVPKVTTEEDEAWSLLMGWCMEKLTKLNKENDDVYMVRLLRELEMMKEHDFLDYMVLIVRVVREALSRGIRRGSGRGSAASSLVCYLTGITGVDPIGHNLLFERFLSPGRKEPPDIDLDFQSDRRDEVKEIVVELMGQDHVCNICNYTTFSLRNTLHKIGRAIDVPYAKIEHATKTFEALEKGGDDDVEMNLTYMRTLSGALDWLANDEPELWHHAIRLEGQCMNLSKHAAGVIVTETPISETIPTMRGGDDGGLVSGWSDGGWFRAISEYGFLKIDILSLKNLAIQEYAIQSIERRTGEKIDVEDPTRFPSADPSVFDPKVIEVFANGGTFGCFQFDSPALTNFVRNLAPVNFDDLVAANALFRPGPLEGGEAHEYGKRKGTVWETDNEVLQRLLGPTRGVMAFQEQVMQVAMELGDFTGEEADDLRKAMGKLYRHGMKVVNDFIRKNGYDKKFLTNAVKNGLDKTEAQEWWKKILGFGGYGFAKAHSCPYSYMGYVDAWLKTNYPADFFAGFLSYRPEKMKRALENMRGHGIRLVPPDVNTSELGFTVLDDRTIQMGLLSVDGIAEKSAMGILNNRPFSSIQDIENRVPKSGEGACNARGKAALWDAGAMDSLGGRPDWTNAQKAKAEKEKLGVPLSNRNDEEELRRRKIIQERIYSRQEFDEATDGKSLVVGGEIVTVKKIRTKKGQDMGFATIRFGDDEYELTLFPEKWEENSHRLEEGEIILAQGVKDTRGLITYAVNTIEEVEESCQ